MIELIEISKKHDQKELFNDFSLTIDKGDFVAIKGESGRGKTTLLNIISGIESLDQGSRRIDDLDYTLMTSQQQKLLYRYKLSFIFQNYGLLTNDTVYKNLSLVLKVKKVVKSDYEQLINKALRETNLAEVDLQAKVYSLSGGEQQRLSIARCLLSNNPIILADEPIGSLDAKNSKLVMILLKKMNQRGRTIVLVTHDNQFDGYYTKIINL